jgi:phage shock protein A
MLQYLRRRWRYFIAGLSGRAEERADPKIQIEQAIAEAKKQHELLVRQAGAVLGNERELEIRLGRELDEVERLKASAGQALKLADEARAAGNAARAAEFDDAALKIATSLTTAEDGAGNMRDLLQKAGAASTAARSAVEQNALRLKQTLAERSKLMTQLEAAKMQERINEAMATVNDMSGTGDQPTLAEVREKIEVRYARAMGRADLTASTVDAAMVEVQRSVIDQKAAERLEQLRSDLGMAAGSPPVRPAEHSLEAAEPLPEFIPSQETPVERKKPQD